MCTLAPCRSTGWPTVSRPIGRHAVSRTSASGLSPEILQYHLKNETGPRFRGGADSNSTGFGSKPVQMSHWKAQEIYKMRRKWFEFCQVSSAGRHCRAISCLNLENIPAISEIKQWHLCRVVVFRPTASFPVFATQVGKGYRDLVFHQLLSLLHTKHFSHPHMKYNSLLDPSLASITILNRPYYHTVSRQSVNSRPTVVLATDCRSNVGDKMSADCQLTHRPTDNRQLVECRSTVDRQGAKVHMIRENMGTKNRKLTDNQVNKKKYWNSTALEIILQFQGQSLNECDLKLIFGNQPCCISGGWPTVQCPGLHKNQNLTEVKLLWRSPNFSQWSDEGAMFACHTSKRLTKSSCLTGNPNYAPDYRGHRFFRALSLKQSVVIF